MFLRNLAVNRLLRNRLTAGTHGCGGGQVAAGACKDGSCPERVYHSRPYCQALSGQVLKIIEVGL